MKKIFYTHILTALAFIFCFNSYAQHTQTLQQRLAKLYAQRQGKNQASNKSFRVLDAGPCDTIRLYRQSQIDSFPITNPGCTVIKDLIIDGSNASSAITRLDSLRQITEVTDMLSITWTDITDLSAFANLTRVDNLLWVENDRNFSNPALPAPASVAYMILQNLPALTTLAGFSDHLHSQGQYQDLDMQLISVSNTSVTDFSGLEHIQKLGALWIFNNNNLQSFSGINNLSFLGDLSISGNPVLTDISALSQITHITNNSSLEIQYNDALSNLTGLQNIALIDGALWIEGNSSLTNLSQLNSNLIIDNVNNDRVLIDGNPQLSVCGVPFLCNYLNTGGAAEIYDNAPGCNSIEEIRASCGITTCTTVNTKTWTGAVDDDWNNDSNWLPTGAPASCDSVIIPSGINTNPTLYSSPTIHALTMMSGTQLFMNSQSLTVNGDVNMNGVIIGGSNVFTSNGARNINITNSTLYIEKINLNNYTDSLTLTNNTINTPDGTIVNISDATNRSGINLIYGNTIQGNLNVTTNTNNNSAETDISTEGEDHVTGDFSLTMNTAAWCNIGIDNTFHLGGSLIVKNDFGQQLSIGGVDFNGSGSDVHITQLGSSPIEIGFAYANKTGGYIILDQNVYINNNFHFLFGVLKTQPDKLLIFKNNAGIDQTSSGSWVWGPIKKIGSQPFTFPIGDNLHQAVISISAPASPTDSVTAQYFGKNPTLDGYDTSHHVSSLTRVSGKEYWTLLHTAGAATGRIMSGTLPPPLVATLSYDSVRSGSLESIYSLRVSNWNSNQWQDMGVSQVTGNPGQAYVTSSAAINNTNILTLGFVEPARKPVITITSMDSVLCQGSTLHIHFSVDTALFSGNQFIAQLSDSSGSFANPYILAGTPIGRTTSDSINVLIAYYIKRSDYYKIRIIGTSPNDTSVNTKPLVIKGTPQLAASYVGPNPACAFSPSKYYITQKEANVNYAWSINGGGTLTTVADTAFITWNLPGNYYFLTLTPSNGCGSGIPYEGTVTVLNPPPSTPPVLSKTGRWLSVPTPPANQGLTINWYRNDTLINGVNATNYYASSAGNYTVRYAANCGVGPVSDTISFAANSIPQTINFPAITNKLYSDSSFVINATSSSGLPVEFTVVSGPGNIPNNTFIITGTGSVTVRASQPGNDVYDTAAWVTQTFTVNKASQTITFPSISDRVYSSSTFNLSASGNSGLPIAYSVLSGPAIANGNTITLTGVGTVTIRASQQGDTNYLAATPVDKSFCIQVPSLNVISGPNSICPAVNATYSVNDIPGATYNWQIAGGATLSSHTSSVTTAWASPGNYTLIVNASGSCGAPSGNDSLLITAITSISPDSVHTMLPADGAINQQLPLTLSWIPANPNLFYTYDIYLWRADSSQPSTPYVGNLSSVNYTIPLNSGLSYNQTYKWMVVAHNGSCTVIHTGPVQQFSLIPLPDLQVYNVNAPSSVFSGQTMTVTWKVKNNGPGNAQLNQHWADAVFISTDSVLNLFNVIGQLHFPVTPMLVTTKQNASALDAGTSYSDTATFTIPVDYSGPLYTHVVTNYAPPAYNPVIENSLVNDTAHSSPATTVILSPTPDLRVETIVNPGNTFSGSTINLTYKVTNHGATANGSWYDKIYISKDPLFNINSATQLKYPNNFGTYYYVYDATVSQNRILPQDSSYTVTIRVIVPNFIYGSYYIYVFTNSTASLYEGADQNNDVDHGNVMQVSLTATPDLRPVNVLVPSSVSNTQTVQVKWNDQNFGAYDNIEKNKGHYYVASGKCQIPCPVSGGNGNVICNPTPATTFKDSVGFGGSYWIDRIYVSTDSTGLNTSNATLLAEVPHGIQNSGLYVNDAVQDSKCAVSNLFNINTYNVVLPNLNYPGGYSYTIPSNLPQGNYYIYVSANPTASVFEYPGLPQITRSNAFTVAWADLTVPSVTAPSTSNSGQPVTISYSLLDNGPGSVYNHYRKDYIYLGSNNSFDGTAILIDSVIYNSASVALNVQQTLQKQTTLPNGISGLKYIFVRANADSSFKEINLNNNINSTGAPINIGLTPAPDFVGSSINIPNVVYTSTGFPFQYTVNNSGAGLASGSWKDSIFISCNPVYSAANSYFVGVRTEQNYVPSSNNYSDSFNLQLPLTFLLNNSNCLNNDTTHAYFFVKTNSNNGIYEPATNNNILASRQVTVINTLVDQIVTNVTSADSAFVGRNFKVKWTVQNIGLNPNDGTYSDYADGVFISTDSVFNDSAKYVGAKSSSIRLNHNQTYTDSTIAILPNTPSGSYYLFVKTNYNASLIAERNLSNNSNLRRDASYQPIKIYVTNPLAPDLIDSITNVPSVNAVGQPIKVVYQVKNNGVGATYPTVWYDEIWLSNDFQPQGLLLGTRYHTGNLNPGQIYSDSLITTLPVTLSEGNYTIVVKTNHDNNIYESDYSNDVDYRYVSVYVPAPVDLIVNNISIADTVILGNSSSVNWNLFNNSNNPANGIETDGIYLSKDSSLSTASDVLVGTKVNQLNLLPLNTTTINGQALISSVSEGNYFVKVKTDILNNIIETDKSNNTTLLNHQVYVKVKLLPMNIVTADTLTSNYLYCKLIVPGALIGKTISVKLVTPDSLTANNQLYVGGNYLPTAAHFDYAFDKPNFGNQQIVIESVNDSVYYIAAKGTKPNGNYQTITLQAVVLPFSILTVNANHGGNSGNVTVQIKGTLFRDSMIAKIHGVSSGNDIIASKVYFVNSTSVYATFNLQGAPLGVYDVTLTKPDLSTTTLSSAFTVEQTNNGGLLTGSGANTGQTGSGNAPGCDPGASSGLNSQLQTEIIIPPKIFEEWPFVIQINYTNASNVDIPAQVKILYSLDGAALSLTQAGLSDGKTTLYIEFKDSNVAGNMIRAGSSGTIKVYSKTPPNAYAHQRFNYTLQ